MDRNNEEESIPGRIQTIVNRGLISELNVEAAGDVFKAVMLTSSIMNEGFHQ